MLSVKKYDLSLNCKIYKSNQKIALTEISSGITFSFKTNYNFWVNLKIRLIYGQFSESTSFLLKTCTFNIIIHFIQLLLNHFLMFLSWYYWYQSKKLQYFLYIIALHTSFKGFKSGKYFNSF